MRKITFIGAGNVASNLSIELQRNGYKIVEIWSQSKDSSQQLANKLKCDWTTNLSKLRETDLFIISVKDDATEEVISNIKNKTTPIVHTSGSVGVDVFKKNILFGVFYPIQSFSKNIILDFEKIPICIESNNKSLEKELSNIANDISQYVHIMSSVKREKLHLAAVFACNFSNHMISISETILEENNIDFNILKPLIYNTINKIQDNSPKKNLTGPAMRKDYNTIKKHLEMIKKDDDLASIYSLISNQIIKNSK